MRRDVTERELMFGNFVKAKSFPNEVVALTAVCGRSMRASVLHSDGVLMSYDIKDLRALEITKSWLLKFGFKEVETDTHYLFEIHDGQYSVRSIGEGAFYFEMHDKRLRQIFSVHELQNVYFNLTGKELILRS